MLHTSIIESEAVFGELSIAIERWAVRVMIRQGERERRCTITEVCVIRTGALLYLYEIEIVRCYSTNTMAMIAFMYTLLRIIRPFSPFIVMTYFISVHIAHGY